MTDTTVNRKYIYIRWLLLRIGLMVFDILAVNAAYYLALLVRFYVNFEFNEWAIKYIPAFFEFAPYYTVCSLAVFLLFGLYNSLWKYASLNDMARIIGASAVTCVIHILGTLLFVRRMPITYYALGAAFQFAMITVSRFSYRLMVIERDRLFKSRKNDAVNVLIVGLGESCRTIVKHLERDPDSMARPVCLIDINNTEFKGTLAGVPVLGGIQRIPEAVRKYEVGRILMAGSSVTPDVRTTVKEIGQELDIPVHDFAGYFQYVPSRIPMQALLQYVEGPVWIEIGNQKTRFVSGDEAVAGISEKYMISSVYTMDEELCIRLTQDILLPNDIQSEWVQTYQKETGEDISFF